MAFYVLTLPQSFTTFQTIVSGGEIHYTLKSSTFDKSMVEDLKTNDVIYMYYAKPQDIIPMKFQVKEKDNDIIILEKEIERYPGLSRPFLNEKTLEESAQVDSHISLIESSLGEEINEGLFQYAALEVREQQTEINDSSIYSKAKELADKVSNFVNKEGQLSHNLIHFGAPGTGKSYTLNENIESTFHKSNYERVTFFNRYTYSNLVGGYKPVEEDGEITYKFVMGPFIRSLVKAYQMIMNTNAPKETFKVALVIEEINRADAASVFGDMFQLLDRKDGKSEYDINVSKELQEELCAQLIPNYDQIIDPVYKEKCLNLWRSIHLPANFYLWATMNSADQGVYPMDTAFKRRWDFNYLSIDENQDLIKNTKIKFMRNGEEKNFDWNDLRLNINNRLFTECNVDEDKLLGPFFLSFSLIEQLQNNPEEYSERFIQVLKNKVFMYLYEDAARHYRDIMFSGCLKNSSFSDICKQFDKKGLDIFQFSKDLR